MKTEGDRKEAQHTPDRPFRQDGGGTTAEDLIGGPSAQGRPHASRTSLEENEEKQKETQENQYDCKKSTHG